MIDLLVPSRKLVRNFALTSMYSSTVSQSRRRKSMARPPSDEIAATGHRWKTPMYIKLHW
jgi:hypothetical protein